MMHDDEDLKKDGDEDLRPEEYPDEEEWERRLLENERLKDKYEKVWNENPDRRWEDPHDLYLKAHYGIDLGEDFKAPEENKKSVDETDSAGGDELPESPSLIDELESVPAYRLALDFGCRAADYLNQLKARNPEEGSLHQRFAYHRLRIAADIAGGHGLGYDEETLCGNIVLNRWALEHAKKSGMLLRDIEKCSCASPVTVEVFQRLGELQKELESRITDLRKQVWWK